jgi:mycothiol synthase
MVNHPIEHQYAFRQFIQERDLAGLVQLRIDVEKFDHEGNDVSEAAVAETLNWPGHDPQKDRWIIEKPGGHGELVGHAWARAQSPERTVIYVAIHPDWRRKGLGSLLLERTLTRAVEMGATHVTAAATIKNKGVDAFLLQNGFHHAGNNRFMRAPAGIPLSEPRWPDGYTVRSYAEVQNLSTLVKAFNRCYGDMWGHRENTKGAMNEDYLAERMKKNPQHYNPDGLLIVFGLDGDVVGVCVAVLGPIIEGQSSNREMIVDSPGVVPEHRHLGLQRPLTQTAMRWLRCQNPGTIALESYGDGEDAVKIYEELGFMLEEHYIEYCRNLR